MTVTSSPASAPLNPCGATWPAGDEARELALRFQSEHYLLLPGLLAPELLERVRRDVASVRFREFTSQGVGTELRMEPSIAVHMLMFLMKK